MSETSLCTAASNFISFLACIKIIVAVHVPMTQIGGGVLIVWVYFNPISVDTMIPLDEGDSDTRIPCKKTRVINKSRVIFYDTAA